MKREEGHIHLSASDLVGHLNCRHLSELNLAVAIGALAAPTVWDPMLRILWERGSRHEASYVDHLIAAGFNTIRIDGVDISHDAVAQTLAAMKSGVTIIVQGALYHEGWSGRVDVLRRIDTTSALGGWSYEAIDTKLARETKAGTVVQLCVYSDLLRHTQGVAPDQMYVVAPWSDLEPRTYRFADYAAYYRRVKRSLERSLEGGEAEATYPDPKDHCEICRWRTACEQRRRDDDHLCLVAGISKVQINELRQRGVHTLHDLAVLPLPLQWKPDRGSPNSYLRVREQARLQFEGREASQGKFEVLPVEVGFGLASLPEPSAGDIFFDLEADPFVGEHGLEYLFGVVTIDQSQLSYRGDWAFSREAEKRVFEDFVDFVMDRWEEFPDLHIYHYAPYEQGALKRLMGRYAAREEEIDRMLRAGLFVDLYGVVRHGIRASVESYSIKHLEPFYGFDRKIALTDVRPARANLEAHLELEDVPSITDEIRVAVSTYNQDDCLSASRLRDWLESLRAQLIAKGIEVPRPAPREGEASESVAEWLVRINGLIARLTEGIPADLDGRDAEQQARWILANILDWHRREDKATWWEYFRLCDLSDEELIDERSGLSGLVFDGVSGGTARAPVHRYTFAPQDADIRIDDELRSLGGEPFGKVQSISTDTWTVEIKKRQDTADFHPKAVFAHGIVRTQVLADALVRIGEFVAAQGIEGDGPYQAARDLLVRRAPRTGGEGLRRPDETALAAAVRLAGQLEGGVLPVQGPPGAGKTFTGARMICELVRRGKKVGITANSHKVIRNLIDATIRAAVELGIELNCCQKVAKAEEQRHRLVFVAENDDLFQSFSEGSHVGGGTAWLWARPEAFETVDVLIIDEAAQLSLANVLAVSHAAKAIILIGDPQQLDQPTRGTHPDSCGVSAMDHILGDAPIIALDKGLFLEDTWRLPPSICAFTSELFYAGKLHSRRELEKQEIRSSGKVQGAGLRYLPVAHEGNRACSPEEADVAGSLVTSILQDEATWIDCDGEERLLTLDDILIITPYNAQVFEIQRRLPGARIGTVDKFQGQEAPIAIYSTATSSHAEAPRGMEFLYSLNRFNVATSRAKCVSILVGSPRLFEAECRTPRQIQLVNAFCRYLELAVTLGR